MEITKNIAQQLTIHTEQVAAAIELLDAGNTIPFIARYRKEATHNLDEEQLRQVSELLEKLRLLDERRQTVLKTINEQGKLTDGLRAQIEAAATLTALEDLYQPYKPKRRTRASIARERGLQPLADLILQQVKTMETLDQLATPFLNEDVPGVVEAWAGARDIVAETISDHPEVRRLTREKALQWGILRCQKVDKAVDAKQVYNLYYEFELRVDRLRPHQVLAINRGETEKVLTVSLFVPERDWMWSVESVYHADRRSLLAGQLQASIADAAERLLLPAIEHWCLCREFARPAQPASPGRPNRAGDRPRLSNRV
jgi:protein Tex